MERDLAYFGRREAEEIIAAEAAMHPKARQAHLELARRYHELAGAASVPIPLVHVVAERSPGLTAAEAPTVPASGSPALLAAASH